MYFVSAQMNAWIKYQRNQNCAKQKNEDAPHGSVKEFYFFPSIIIASTFFGTSS